MVVRLEQIALATDNVVVLRDFYLRLGGVALPPCADALPELDSCAIDFCGVRLELCAHARHERSRAAAHLGFALGSADAVDELTNALAAVGFKVLEPAHRSRLDGVYESLVLDPDGNGIKLTI